jgi:hypothetical protein
MARMGQRNAAITTRYADMHGTFTRSNGMFTDLAGTSVCRARKSRIQKLNLTMPRADLLPIREASRGRPKDVSVRSVPAK